jgi:nitrite reductase/ring-hydroxylating ferredoxin subunit
MFPTRSPESPSGRPSVAHVVDLGPVDEVLPGDRATVRVGEDAAEVVLVRRRKRIVAFENRCPHAGGRLDEAPVSGRTITCPSHAYRFDVFDGACVRGLRRPPRLRLYRAWVADEHLLLAT